ncbi:Cna B-type domain-containing protein [Helcococcus kunzii]
MIKSYKKLTTIFLAIILLISFIGPINIAKANEIADEQPRQGTYDIYLDGQKGDDNNDGKSLDKPIKTFNKAKELATDAKKIIVVGKTAIEGDIDLVGLNVDIIRGENFNDYLFEISSDKTASLKNITIDGNSENNKSIEKSLVYVNNGGTINIGEGAVLRNNIIKDIENDATEGGAIKASGALINMTAGIIEKNQATRGGGIYLGNSTLNFSGGVIQNNESKRVYDKPYNQYYSAGGGIIATKGSTINLSNKAKILNNKAGENGGGISIGSRIVESGDNTLNMSGGIIDGNIAGTSGGGIFIQAKYFSGGLGRAKISSGYITNNYMTNTGKTESLFGGGGIYVNGATEEYGKNGELNLTNALIYNNESEFEGAGYAACPISNTIIHVTNGVALYNNKASQGNELFIYSSMNLGPHSGQPEYDITDRMLGGKAYNWQKEDGSFLKLEEHKGKLETEGQKLLLHTSEQANDFAKNLAKVIISGNKSATRGGGIGSNGTVTFGKENELTKVAVSKVWNDNDNTNKSRPDQVEVDLVAKLEGEEKEYLVESKVLNKDNEWKTVFENLPIENDGKKITYTVKEKEVKGYTSEITGNQDQGFTVTNTHTPEKIEIKGQKIWDDDDNQDGKRPDQITVKLFANGKEVAKKEVKSDENGKWSYSFANLDKYENGKEIIYTVSEEKVEGYVSQVNGYDITNTYKPRKTSINVVKRWDDKNDQDKLRPTSISIVLLADGEETDQKLVLTKENNWSGQFTGLDEYKDGKKIVYTIREEKVKGYTSEITGNQDQGFTVTNIHTPEKIEIKGQKIWDDDDNQDGKRPDQITVKLFANGKEVAKKEVKSDENGKWSYSFANLDKYENGKEIIYTVSEEKVEGYVSQVNGYDITNTYKPRKTSINVVKRWDDKNDQDKLRPTSISIVLLADGEETDQKLVLTKENNWSGQFTGLDEYKDGKKIVYTIREEKVKGYTSEITGNQEDSFVVTNRHKPKTPPKTPNTGDDTNIVLYAGVGLVGVIVLLFISYKKKEINN